MHEQDWKTKDLDVVYFVREGENEELKYSLRSIAENLEFHSLWIYGGKPAGIEPDNFVRIPQTGGGTEWDRVRANFRLVGMNQKISENFILMNDDFFINQHTEEIPPAIRGSLRDHYEKIERKHHGTTPYTIELRRTERALEALGCPTNSYELHIPMIINRHKLLEIIGTFPDRHATRTLYGNWNRIGGELREDVKVVEIDTAFDPEGQFISSDDATWGNTPLGNFIKDKYPRRSKWETGR